MRNILVALAAVLSLLPGCCVIGSTIGGSRAAAHNEEVTRKLERGEYVGPEEREEQSVDSARLTGFAVGALIDAAVIALVVHEEVSSINLGAPAPQSDY